MGLLQGSIPCTRSNQQIKTQMARPYILQDANYNIFILVMILLAFFFIAWGDLNKVESGSLYLTLLVVGIGTVFFIREHYKENNEGYKKLYVTPFLSSFKVAVAMYLVGYVVIFLINFVGKVVNPAFSSLQFFSPLYLSGSGFGSGISATYLASIIENTQGFKLAYGVLVAGTIEEYVFGFALFLAGWFIGMFILKLLNNEVPFGLKERTFNKLMAYVFVFFGFMGIHALNSSYTGYMFLVAGLFRLAMTICIYEFGLGLAFAMGMHHANNLFAFLFYEGFAGLGNFIGVMYVLFLLVLLGFTIKNLFTDKFKSEFKKDVLDYRSG
jgi:hypothetical protein